MKSIRSEMNCKICAKHSVGAFANSGQHVAGVRKSLRTKPTFIALLLDQWNGVRRTVVSTHSF